MKPSYLILLTLSVLFSACNPTLAPEPFGAIPSKRQLEWHELEFYAFVHFNMNTFTNMEWGMGSEKPEWFNPTELDTRQWAKVFKEAGMKGVILTAKHHDGFCLWPSNYTEHSVKNSPWRDGKGDLVRELADACKEYGLKFGVYLSPWDRNHAEYGRPEYITYYRNQLRELLTNYGDIFEVWFDGANGGTGWYGGANEERRINRETYYDWENTFKIVRELQPSAVIFSDAGPDIRWVGNEQGWARPTNWSLLKREDFLPGVVEDIEHLRSGQEDGTHWLPAEVDVSIRPGWYYHPSEDHQVKTLPELLDIFYNSVGRNASLLLNFPIDKRGLVHEKEVEQVMKLANTLKKDFGEDLAAKKPIIASNVRGNSKKFMAKNAIDENPETYWATNDDVIQCSLTIDLGQPTKFNRFLAQEYIRLGQRVKKFRVEAMVSNQWQTVAEETTIGYKRILRLPTVTATQVRFTVEDAKACPIISNIQIFNAPKVLEPPIISRNQDNIIKIKSFDNNLDIYYTTDNSQPSTSSEKYEKDFVLNRKAVVKAFVMNPVTGDKSTVTTQILDVPKTNWKLFGEIGKHPQASAIFDGNLNTSLIFSTTVPAEIKIDLGEIVQLSGFSYMPNQGRGNKGTIVEYEFYVSVNGKTWSGPVAGGEFSNIKNNPVLQTVTFSSIPARYLKFKALSTVNDQQYIGIAELDVITT